MSLARPAAAVFAVDGERCEPVRTKRQLAARVAQLDDPGVAAADAALRHAAEAASQPLETDAEVLGPEGRARQRLQDRELVMRLNLVRCGIPFHHAMQLAPDEPVPLDASWALTFAIGLGMARGAEFDWTAGRWRRT